MYMCASLHVIHVYGTKGCGGLEFEYVSTLRNKYVFYNTDFETKLYFFIIL